MQPSIIFLRVADTKTKLMRICNAIHQNFTQGKKILIHTPSPQASQYIDELLWSSPIESFLPHEIVHQKTTIPVAITQQQENLNEAQILINLCPHIHPNYPAFQKVYELWDLTHPTKEKESEQRKNAYEALKAAVYVED